MIYGYIRVSSDKQTVENQRFEINKFCDCNKLVIDGWIEETISGMKAYNKRELGKLLKRVQKDDLLTSSLRHPKIFIKEFGDFLMPCHQHCLGVKMESVNRFMLLLLL